MDSKKAKENLKRLTEHLRKLKLPLKPQAQPVQWAADVASAIENYLNGTEISLDAAFGLKREPGKPSNPDALARNNLIAIDVFSMRLEGASLSDNRSRDGVYTLIGKKYNLSPKAIEKIYSISTSIVTK